MKIVQLCSLWWVYGIMYLWMHVNKRWRSCTLFRSSHSQIIFKIDVFQHFANLARQHLCWCLFLIKLQAFRSATPLKKKPAQVFSCGICEIFKSTFFTEHPQWLLLHFSQALYIPKLSLILLRLLQKKTEILGIVGTNTASIYLLKPPMEMPDQCAKSVQR